MQIITDLSLLAGVASTAMATTPSPAAAAEVCSTFSTTITSTVAAVTVTVTSAASSVAAGPMSHSSITSDSCTVPAMTSSSSVSAWISTEVPSVTTSAAWTLSTYTGVNPLNATETLTSTHCAQGSSMIAGVNTVDGTSGISYLVCAVSDTVKPTVGTLTSKATADAFGATHTSAFSFYPTGTANATVGPIGSGSGFAHPTTAVTAPVQSLVPFTGGAAALNSGKASAALVGIAVAMLFI